MEKFSASMQETYNAMIEEYNTKITTYQQMSANWTPSVLATKQQEIQDLEARITQYNQNAQMDMNNLQQQLMAPIQQKANEAVTKVGKANGLIYVFDTSMGVIPYFDAAQSMDVTEQVKIELNIPLDKMLPQAQPQR
jgi:outer membrane protein